MTLCEVVSGVQSDDPAALTELYRMCRRKRYYFWRHLHDQDSDDRAHDLFITIVKAVRADMIQQPEHLPGYLMTIARRMVFSVIRDRTGYYFLSLGELERPPHDPSHNPEMTAYTIERAEIARRGLRAMAAKDREILTRFYVWDQAQTDICKTMQLTATQFRLLKTRAKSRLAKAALYGQTRRKLIASNSPA